MRFPLFSHGILGMNGRNLLYIKPHNPRKAIALADDKMKVKSFLSARDIPTAKVFAHITSEQQLQSFDFSQLPDECVLKPNFGFGGEGIRVFRGRKDGKFLESKRTVDEDELRRHIERILEGEFSVNGKEDTAFFEQLLVAHDGFAPFRPAGLPDIRFVVFNLVPVMAMVRIPTPESDGKANVHLGGVGIGIDMARGTTTYAVQYNHLIDRLPNGIDPKGIPIPYWEEMLLIASRIQQMTDIGYLAVDLTIDDKSGPMLLEVNARAGLMVQIANLAPLRSRLERIAGLKVQSPEKGVLLAQELFGQKLVTPRKTVQKIVVGVQEIIRIPSDEGDIEVTAVANPSYERTAFSPTLVQELLRLKALEPESLEKKTYRARFTLGGKKIQTIIGERAIVDPLVRVSLGRRDLADFLIDPAKKTDHAPKERIALKVDLYAVDRQLHQLERMMPILKSVKPQEYQLHLLRARQDRSYEPVFTYEPIDADLAELRSAIVITRTDNSPLGVLLGKKRDELLKRINLLEARGDSAGFTSASMEIYGKADAELFTAAKARLDAREACLLPPKPETLRTAEQVKVRFEEVLEGYGLLDWTVQLRENLLSDCAIGKKRVYIREGKMFDPVHIDSLIAHEIEAHALCAENGANQPYLLLQSGMANYLQTQEGLAVTLQDKVLPQYHDKLYWSAQNVLAVDYALRHGFAQLRTYLEDIGYAPEKSLTKALALKRGMGDTSKPGAFTKDLVYERGRYAIAKYLEDGGDIKRLYVGRVAIEDLELVEKLPELKPPILLPKNLGVQNSKKQDARNK